MDLNRNESYAPRSASALLDLRVQGCSNKEIAGVEYQPFNSAFWCECLIPTETQVATLVWERP
jgi:hypothetical protein